MIDVKAHFDKALWMILSTFWRRESKVVSANISALYSGEM